MHCDTSLPPSPCPLPLRGRGRSGVEGAPAGFGFVEAGAAVDEGQVPGAEAPLLVRGRLVQVESGRIEGNAVVLEGAAGGDEAARHVRTHPLGIGVQRIAPAPTAARLE